MAAVDLRWWDTVLTGSAGTLSSSGVEAASEQYSVLPRPGDPRVIVDQGSPRAMSDAVERMVSARTSNQLVRDFASRSSSLALRRKADWGVSGGEGLGTLREHLCEVLDRSVQLSISVGPPRPNQKPVVRCYEDDALVAVAKLGPDPHTKVMVENEALWLETLQADPIDDVVTPGLLHSGSYGASALLVMEPLDLENDLGISVDDMPMTVLEQLVDRFAGDTKTVTATDWWTSLPGRLGESQMETLGTTIDDIAGDPLVDQLAVSAWHGDWSPWNTGRTRGGARAIWDWERATIGVPTGFDVLHLHYQYGAGLDGATLGLAGFGIPVAQHRLLCHLYLLELCARHAEAQALETPRHAAALNEFGRLK